jgi:hypothetical protein
LVLRERMTRHSPQDIAKVSRRIMGWSSYEA